MSYSWVMMIWAANGKISALTELIVAPNWLFWIDYIPRCPGQALKPSSYWFTSPKPIQDDMKWHCPIWAYMSEMTDFGLSEINVTFHHSERNNRFWACINPIKANILPFAAQIIKMTHEYDMRPFHVLHWKNILNFCFSQKLYGSW